MKPELPDQPQPTPSPHTGGIIHAYQKFDPKNFPSPTQEPPDLASAAMEHMLQFGSMREFTEEELANAIKIDPSMFPSLGPSLGALRALLEERKRKILTTFETDAAQQAAAQAYDRTAREVDATGKFRDSVRRALAEEQIRDLERLWYQQKDEQSPLAKGLLRAIDRLGDKYQVDELASTYDFTGKTEMGVPQALEVKAELEAIDKLLEQLKDAEKNAQLAIIDMDALSEFVDGAEIEQLNQLQQQIQDYVREQARAQGLEMTRAGYNLSPKAFRIFQRKLLQEIFADLTASRSGRHSGPVVGEGAVELQKTRDYAFGDSAAHLDITQTVINAAARGVREGSTGGFRSSDIAVHLTRNNPKCATMVLMDMSGSMRHAGQYIHCKRMALALDGLIRGEFPGDYLGFVEMYSFAKIRHVSEVPTLLPKPVSIHNSVVRLKANMSDPNISEMRLPQHFTNIQHALSLSRRVLSAQDTPNRQVILITDGLPTAHFEGPELFLLYPPDPRTEAATMREAMLCKQANITINIFLVPSWSQGSEDIAFAHKMAETTKGRVFFTGGRDLDRFVLWDYVANRRKVIG